MTVLKMSPVLMMFKEFPYQLSNKEYLIAVFEICPFFVLPVKVSVLAKIA